MARRRVERGRHRNREAGASCSRYEIGEQVFRDRERFAFGQRAHAAARQNLRRRPHIERIAAFEGEIVRPADLDRDSAWPRAGRAHRNRNAIALLGCQFEYLRLVALEPGGTVGDKRHHVIAGRTFDVVEFELDRAFVAGAQEARERRGQHDGIADNDVAGRLADFVLAPCYGHHANGAGESRNIKLDLRASIATNGDNPGVKCERRLRRRRAGQFGAASIAARTDLPARTLHAVNQLAVKVADLGSETALPEIVIVGRRRFVVGEIENADVDGRHNDARLLAGNKSGELDRHRQRRTWPHR